MSSLFQAPADTVALQRLEESQHGSSRFKLKYLFGARVLEQTAGYWYNHVICVNIVARQLRRLVKDGYRVLPQVRVPGIQNDLVDFVVISPRGSVYAIIAHEFHPNKVKLTRDLVLAGGKAYKYPADLRAKADAIALRLRQHDYPHTEVIPMLVVVDTAWLSARGSGRVKSATDATMVRKIRAHEDKRMRQGIDVVALDNSIMTPEFWDDERVFEPTAYERRRLGYRHWHRFAIISEWASLFWHEIAWGIGAGIVLSGFYWLYTHSNMIPGTMMLVPGSH